jgi:hypothetical protein
MLHVINWHKCQDIDYSGNRIPAAFAVLSVRRGLITSHFFLDRRGPSLTTRWSGLCKRKTFGLRPHCTYSSEANLSPLYEQRTIA